jgi:endonuclease III
MPTTTSRSRELLQKALSEVGYNPKIIKEMYLSDASSFVIEKELSKLKPGIRTGAWSIEETTTILHQYKAKGLELSASSLLPKLNRSYDSILSRSFKVSLWIKATQLQLQSQSKDSSVHAAVDFLLEKIHRTGECNVELRRNAVYMDLLHQGIKKYGLYPEKIVAEFLPSFCVSGVMMDLLPYKLPDRKLHEAMLNMEIAKHVHQNGFFRWEELSKRLGVPLERLVKRWDKMRELYDQDPDHFEREFEKIMQSQKIKWDTKCENTLTLGIQIFNSDIEQIQHKLLPQFDQSFLRLKILLRDPLVVSQLGKPGAEAETILKTIASERNIPFELLTQECKNVKKSTAIDVHELDKHIKSMVNEKNPSLTAIAKNLGVDYSDVLVRWNKLRKLEGIPSLKKRGIDDLRKLLPAEELKKLDSLIVEYATSPNKSLSELAKVVGKKPGSIYRRWNELRTARNLQSVRKARSGKIHN